MIKGVIFDMDGVLIISEGVHVRSAKKAFQKHSIDLKEEDVGLIVGRTSPDALRLLMKKYKLNEEMFETLLHEKRVFYREKYHEIQLREGIKEVLNKLREKYRIGLATNSSKHYADITLKRLPDVFEKIATGDEVEKPKPSPDVYLKILDKMKLSREECIVIEDSSVGTASAKAAGIKVIACPTEYTKGGDFSKADVIVKDLREITVGFIERLNPDKIKK